MINFFKNLLKRFDYPTPGSTVDKATQVVGAPGQPGGPGNHATLKFIFI